MTTSDPRLFDNLAVTHRDGVTTIVIDRPTKLNALNAETLSEIERAFDAHDNHRKIFTARRIWERTLAGHAKKWCEDFGIEWRTSDTCVWRIRKFFLIVH